MQTAVFEPQILVFPDVRIAFRFPIKEDKEDREDKVAMVLFRSLPEKGLDRLTEAKIEHILCTSALSAHI